MRSQKVMLNQHIVPNLDLQPIHKSNTAYVEFNILSEDENNLEKLQVGFKIVKLAKQFHDVAQNVMKKVTEVQNKSLPATTENFGLEDVRGENQSSDEDDKDKDEDDYKDERSVMFTKCCTLSELSLCRMWKPTTMVNLQIYYDPGLNSARIVVTNDDGKPVRNTLIGLNMCMSIEKEQCIWNAGEWVDGNFTWKMVRATFNSEVVAQEFHLKYTKAFDYAQEVGIVNTSRHHNDTGTAN